ncbi:MAG: hypothetical protein WEB52_13405 [Dehalococcoidia bacterium]
MSDLAIRIHVWMTSTLAALRSEERGQDLIEYALWCGVIALFLIAVGALALYTGAVTAMSTGIGNCIDYNTVTPCTPF